MCPTSIGTTRLLNHFEIDMNCNCSHLQSADIPFKRNERQFMEVKSFKEQSAIIVILEPCTFIQTLVCVDANIWWDFNLELHAWNIEWVHCCRAQRIVLKTVYHNPLISTCGRSTLSWHTLQFTAPNRQIFDIVLFNDYASVDITMKVSCSGRFV